MITILLMSLAAISMLVIGAPVILFALMLETSKSRGATVGERLSNFPREYASSPANTSGVVDAA